VADEMDEVTQRFEADVTQYLADLEEATGAAEEFAGANDMAGVALGSLRDDAAEAGAALDGVRDSAAEAAAAEEAAGTAADETRDRLAEVAAAAGIYRDEMGRLRDAQGKFIAQSTLEDLALGHTRDEALEAAAAMRALKDEKEAASRGGLLSGLMSGLGGLGGGGGGGGGGASAIPLLGTLIESPELLIAIVPAVAAIVTEVGALATGLVAAGLGVGSFVALALPAFKQVFGALGDTKEQLAKLPEPVQQAVAGVKSLKDEFEKMSKAFEPTAFKVLNDGLKIAGQLLPYVGQFAKAASPAIEDVLNGLSRAIASPSFKQFMGFLESLSGPVITAVGSGMAGLAKDVMRLMESFSKKDVINAINIAFRLMGAALEIVIGIVKGSMATWDWITQKALPAVRNAFDTTRHAVATAGHDIATAFDTVRHAVATAGHDIATAFDTVRHAVATVGHDIQAGLGAAANWIKSNWKNILGWLVAPVLMAAGEIDTHTHQIASAFDTARHEVASILDGWRHDIASAFDGVRHDIAAFIDWLPHAIAVGWDDARHDTASGLDNIRHDIASRFDTVRHDIAAWIDDVLNFFKQLPGQILSFLARLPGDMVTIGRNIVQGMINGVRSMAGTLLSAIENLIPSPIRSLVSDALGLASPSKVFFGYGTNIVQGLINGVASMQPHLRSAMQALSGNVTAPGSALAAGAVGPAGGTSVHVQVPMTVQGAAGAAYTDPRFAQYMQQQVQEAVLRYGQINAGNGLTPAWGR